MNFASAAIVITLQNSVLEHFLVKTMARPCTLKILVWLLLGVETVEGLITPTVENASHAQHEIVFLERQLKIYK